MEAVFEMLSKQLLLNSKTTAPRFIKTGLLILMLVQLCSFHAQAATETDVWSFADKPSGTYLTPDNSADYLPAGWAVNDLYKWRFTTESDAVCLTSTNLSQKASDCLYFYARKGTLTLTWKIKFLAPEVGVVKADKEGPAYTLGEEIFKKTFTDGEEEGQISANNFSDFTIDIPEDGLYGLYATVATYISKMENTYTTASAPLTVYGSLEQSNAWEPTPRVGFYKLDINDDNDPQVVSATQTASMATGGGAYYDGYLYFINGNATWLSINNDFMKLDVDQWKVIGGSNHKSPTKTDSYCMAYDYSTGQMYASSEDRSNGKRYLRTVDLETGEFTDVCEVGHHYPAMAFDADGQLWGFSQETYYYPKKVTLYKIDKNTGEETFVGDIGYNQKPEYACAMFDYRTGKLYWASSTYNYNEHYEEFYESYICEVDTATGKATPVKTFNNGEIFSTLFFKDCHPKAPEAASNIAFNTGSGFTEGTIDFDLPANRYDCTPLTGDLKAEIFIDGELDETMTDLVPGTRVSGRQTALAEGGHKVRIYLYDSDNNKSCAADFNAWSGADVPGKVTDIKIDVTPRGETATITWNAPAGSKSGGRFDKDNMSYRIVRRPDMTEIATDLKETSFTDTPDRVMKLSQYEIYAETPDGASDPAYSSTALVGQAHPLTYLETFDTASDFNTYTAIDVNGTGTPEGDCWIYDPQYKSAIYWVNYGAYNKADAWLITPTLDLEADNVYSCSFNSRGYSSSNYYTYSLSAHAGSLPAQESMGTSFIDIMDVSESNWTNHSAMFIAGEDDCRIGLHLTDAEDHCAIDNVRVAYYGPSTIPGVPEVISCIKKGKNARINVKVPDVDAKGRTISAIDKISLYRTGESAPAAVLENPVPGNEVALEDVTPLAGDNNYTIIAANAYGDGLEAFASINMLSSKPVAAENLALSTDAAGKDVSISWDYPQGYPSASGEQLDPEEIVYDIYRTITGEKTLVVRDLKTTSYIDAEVTGQFPDRQQEDITYQVVARTSGGEAAGTNARVLVGRPYEMPVMIPEFFESEYYPMVSYPGTAWTPGTAGYTPWVSKAYNGISFMRCYDAGVTTQTWTLPRINLTGLDKPALRFMMYCTNSAEAEGASLEIGVVVDKDGVEQPIELIPDTYSCKSDEDGWKQIDVDLSAYASYNRASIVFAAHATEEHQVYIDDIQIFGEKIDRDMRVTGISGPANCVMNRENIYTAEVHNNGKQPIENATVSFSVNDTEVYSENVSAAADEVKTITLTYVPDFADEDFTATLTATVTTDGDGNTDNDSSSMKIQVVRPNVPYVDDLQGAYDSEAEEVTLTWSEAVKYPRAKTVKEDFESYQDFIIEGIGDWTLVDRDGAATIGGIQSMYGNYYWKNAGLPQAYIVFNPKEVGVTDLATAYSGEKCLAAFCAAKTNDDWLISPQLLGQEQEISFYARAMNPGFPNEKFEILYSTSGTDISDFSRLEAADMNSAVWTNYRFILPDGARYFAIRCISDNQFALMLDDIEYTPAQPSVNLLGYKVYRDDLTLQESVGETEYADKGVKTREKHTYQVSALYADGESIRSNAVVIEASGIDSVADDGVKVFSANGLVNITGAEGRRIVITTIDGKMLYNFTGTGADRVALTPDVYVVIVGKSPYRIMVK